MAQTCFLVGCTKSITLGELVDGYCVTQQRHVCALGRRSSQSPCRNSDGGYVPTPTPPPKGFFLLPAQDTLSLPFPWCSEVSGMEKQWSTTVITALTNDGGTCLRAPTILSS
jgi:hypothetical protein